MPYISSIFSSYETIGKMKYADFYQRHLAHLSPNILLEIGVASGNSLRAWKQIFPQCSIYGIDIDPRYNYADLNIFIGDQLDTVFLASVLKTIGIPDIIIDDGGHKRSQQTKTFNYLFPLMKKDSIYIVEDLQTNLLKPWNDQEESFLDLLSQMFKQTDYQQIIFEPNHGQSICLIRA